MSIRVIFKGTEKPVTFEGRLCAFNSDPDFLIIEVQTYSYYINKQAVDWIEEEDA